MFQVMGYHWQALGYASADDWLAAMQQSEREHLRAVVGFIELDPQLHKALKAGKWSEVARRYNGPAYDPEKEVLITVGVSEAMYLAMQAILDPGDEVIVPQPCFVSYTADVILAGGTVVDVPTYASNNFVLTPEQIEAVITPRTKALLIGYPCNPTGAVMNREEMLAIAEVAQRHDLIVISDEIYDRLVYGDHQHVMFASLPGMAERTIHLGGMSKDYAMTGWRIGYAAGPEPLIKLMAKVMSQSTSNPCSVSQYAAVEALSGPQDFIKPNAALFQKRRDLVVSMLNQAKGIHCPTPEGAFYVYPSVAGLIGKTAPSGKIITSDESFATELLESEGVAVVHGEAFGLSPHFRISYATANSVLQDACARIQRFCAAVR
jgi:aspartate aminotransferase